MRVRSFSHVGLTVSSFNRFVQFYSDVFGCRLVGVADHPAERVRTFFGIPGGTRVQVGWVRVPGGGILEIFEFDPQQPAVAMSAAALDGATPGLDFALAAGFAALFILAAAGLLLLALRPVQSPEVRPRV